MTRRPILLSSLGQQYPSDERERRNALFTEIKQVNAKTPLEIKDDLRERLLAFAANSRGNNMPEQEVAIENEALVDKLRSALEKQRKPKGTITKEAKALRAQLQENEPERIDRMRRKDAKEFARMVCLLHDVWAPEHIAYICDQLMTLQAHANYQLKPSEALVAMRHILKRFSSDQEQWIVEPQSPDDFFVRVYNAKAQKPACEGLFPTFTDLGIGGPANCLGVVMGPFEKHCFPGYGFSSSDIIGASRMGDPEVMISIPDFIYPGGIHIAHTSAGGCFRDTFGIHQHHSRPKT